MSYRINPDALAECMNSAGVSKTQLADRVGISIQYVCDIHVGRRTLERNPSLRRQIAAALDVPQSKIEVRQTDPTPPHGIPRPERGA
jgi:transcriptional regulator with XRE-family HTH domain